MYSAGDISAMYTGEDYSQNPYFSYDVEKFQTRAKGRYANYVKALSDIESRVGAGKLLDVGWVVRIGRYLGVKDRR